jgi:hypothetical protein
MARLRSKSGSYDQGIIASSSAPSAAFVGQIWFNSATGVTYQWTTDGASNFWLDISSAGIGTSAERGVDYVGDADPIKTHNGGSATLSVGQVYYNREKNRHFICTDASNNANVWSGRYDGAGGTVSEVVISGTTYRTHAFLSNGTFSVDGGGATCDVLIVAGGGAGGNANGGGGGAGGIQYKAGHTVAAGDYPFTVGDAGLVEGTGLNNSIQGGDGGASVAFGVTATGGGGGGSGVTGTTAHSIGRTGGSGGGCTHGNDGPIASNLATVSGWTKHGNVGGSGSASDNEVSAGGGGAGAVGEQGGTDGTGHSGDGGAGVDYSGVYGTTYGASGWFAGGGGGGLQKTQHGSASAGTATHGGGAGTQSNSTRGASGTTNTGGGGGGGIWDGSMNHAGVAGGNGGSGIILIRYALT